MNVNTYGDPMCPVKLNLATELASHFPEIFLDNTGLWVNTTISHSTLSEGLREKH